MNHLESFFSISIFHLNLFSFMLGMLWVLWNIRSWGNPRGLWFQVVFYTIVVAGYYFAKSEGWIPK